MYKHLEKLNVKLNLPNTQVSQYTAKKFRSASEICKYECSYEENVLKELGGDPEEKNKRDSRRYSIRNEEIMKSLSELREEEEEENSQFRQKVEKFVPARKDSETMLRMKAETAGEMYLGVEDADEKIVKSFNLFDGNVKKSAEFLVVAEELEELGFEEEKVVSALMLFSNDRESALQFLMKD